MDYPFEPTSLADAESLPLDINFLSSRNLAKTAGQIAEDPFAILSVMEVEKQVRLRRKGRDKTLRPKPSRRIKDDRAFNIEALHSKT
jgi:hypothetical protein